MTDFKTTLRKMFVMSAGVAVWLVVGAAYGAEMGLTIAEARERAVLANRKFLQAKEEINKAQAEVVQARAAAFPTVTAAASWDHNYKIASQFITMGDSSMELKFGTKESFGASLTAQQAIWTGGKVFNAWSIAKLYHEYSKDNAQRAEDEIRYNADVLFYATILQRATLDVLNKALEANSKNLEVVEQLYSKGMASEYEVLRARVERANLLPSILEAESNVTLAEKRLKSFLGIPLGDTVQVIEQSDDTSLTSLPELQKLTQVALASRPDLQASQRLVKIAKKAISISSADYQPTLAAYANWAWSAQSDVWQLNRNNSHSLTAGLKLSWTLFDGLKTPGAVSYRRAEYRQSTFAEAQLRDDVTLEVEEAYNQIIQAKKSLDVQKETIAQAEEGYRISKLRYEQGVGTQLEVLSSQTALTQARQALAAALFQFRQAKAGLKKATTIDLDAK